MKKKELKFGDPLPNEGQVIAWHKGMGFHGSDIVLGTLPVGAGPAFGEFGVWSVTLHDDGLTTLETGRYFRDVRRAMAFYLSKVI